MLIAFLAAFGTAIGYTISALLEDRVAKHEPSVPPDGGLTPHPASTPGTSAVRTALQPLYLVGMTVSIVAWALSLVALRSLPVFAVQAIGGSSVGFVVAFGLRSATRRPDRTVLRLLVLLMVGLIALAASAAPGSPHPTTHLFPISMWAAVLVIGAAAWQFRALPGRRGSAILGIVSGLADSAIALCGRGMNLSGHRGLLVALDPLALAIPPLAVIGAVAFAGALQRGAAGPALACQHAVMTVVPAAVGLLVFGDHARAGWSMITVGGFVATLAAVVLLTLDPRCGMRVATGVLPQGRSDAASAELAAHHRGDPQ